MKKILPFFSYVLHPVFIPIYATLLYIAIDVNIFTLGQQFRILFQIAIITFCIPVAFFFLLRALGRADSIMLSSVAQRKFPLFLQILLLYLLISQSMTEEVIPELHFFLLGGLYSSFAALTLASFGVKASLHMLGMSSLTGFLIGLSVHNVTNLLPLIAVIVLANGLVASSRLQMKAHTGIELVLGFCCGLLPQIGLWHFWL